MTASRSGSSRPPRGRRKAGAVLASVRPLVERLAEERDVVLWSVEFVREAGQEILRVALDREGGIDAEALQAFSETLSRELDALDAVPGEQRYVLEVSSPGAERRLRRPDEFRVCRGRHARVTFRDGRPPLEGSIGLVTEEGFELERDGGSVPVSYDEISQARLSVPGVPR